jgi:dipeptidyl aminopeptidase/acylaminoacyl peptidase
MFSFLQPFRRRTAILAGLPLLALVAAATISWRNYHSVELLFEADPPAPMLAAPRLAGIANLKVVWFMSRDGLRIAGWYVPSKDGSAVIVAHGTNSDRSSMLAEMRLLANAGFGVLAFDWPGLGESTGEVRWDGQARRAMVAAIDWLASRPDVDARRIGGLGFSIGAFVLTQVAAEDKRLRAVVLEAPPPAFEDYLQLHDTRWGYISEWAGRLAMRHAGLMDPAVEPARVIARIAPRPVLMLGGTNDNEVPTQLVSKLFRAARDPKALWIVPGAGHGNYYSVAAADYTSKLTGFFGANLRRN